MIREVWLVGEKRRVLVDLHSKNRYRWLPALDILALFATHGVEEALALLKGVVFAKKDSEKKEVAREHLEELPLPVARHSL